MKASWKAFLAGSAIATGVWFLMSKKDMATGCMHNMGKAVSNACDEFKETMNPQNECPSSNAEKD